MILNNENNKELAKSFISNITKLKESNDSSNSESFEESVKVKKSKK